MKKRLFYCALVALAFLFTPKPAKADPPTGYLEKFKVHIEGDLTSNFDGDYELHWSDGDEPTQYFEAYVGEGYIGDMYWRASWLPGAEPDAGVFEWWTEGDGWQTMMFDMTRGEDWAQSFANSEPPFTDDGGFDPITICPVVVNSWTGLGELNAYVKREDMVLVYWWASDSGSHGILRCTAPNNPDWIRGTSANPLTWNFDVPVDYDDWLDEDDERTTPEGPWDHLKFYASGWYDKQGGNDQLKFETNDNTNYFNLTDAPPSSLKVVIADVVYDGTSAFQMKISEKTTGTATDNAADEWNSYFVAVYAPTRWYCGQ